MDLFATALLVVNDNVVARIVTTSDLALSDIICAFIPFQVLRSWLPIPALRVYLPSVLPKKYHKCRLATLVDIARQLNKASTACRIPLTQKGVLEEAHEPINPPPARLE